MSARASSGAAAMVDLASLASYHAVYRCYDAQGDLLYIGITGRFSTRLSSHAEKTWFLAVTEIRLEWYPGEQSARAAERAAIKREMPKYNITHNVGVVDGWRPRPAKPVDVPEPPGSVTIREAVAARILPWQTPGGFRVTKYRAIRAGKPVPRVVGKRGNEPLYDRVELAEWAELVRS